MVSVITSCTIIEEILRARQLQLGAHYHKYRNHVYRVFNLALILCEPGPDDYKALAIAAAFHDIGIWTAHTFDYLAPSVDLAQQYLKENGLTQLAAQVTEIIHNHHKLSRYASPVNMVEAFRRADLIDLSLGLIRFGIQQNQISELSRLFPTRGFHRFIAGQAVKNTFRHPLNPLPMMRW